MILCHTPLKQLVPKYHDKFVLVSGCGDVLALTKEYGFAKAIHVDEFFALHPELCNLAKDHIPKERVQKNR
jgi:hypothetical protein